MKNQNDIEFKVQTAQQLGEKGFGPVEPPPYYDREPEYDNYIWEKDVMVPMRDGVRIFTDQMLKGSFLFY